MRKGGFIFSDAVFVLDSSPRAQDLQSQIKQYQFVVKEPGNYNTELQEFWPEQTFDKGHPLFCTTK